MQMSQLWKPFSHSHSPLLEGKLHFPLHFHLSEGERKSPFKVCPRQKMEEGKLMRRETMK